MQVTKFPATITMKPSADLRLLARVPQLTLITFRRPRNECSSNCQQHGLAKCSTMVITNMP